MQRRPPRPVNTTERSWDIALLELYLLRVCCASLLVWISKTVHAYQMAYAHAWKVLDEIVQFAYASWSVTVQSEPQNQGTVKLHCILPHYMSTAPQPSFTR